MKKIYKKIFSCTLLIIILINSLGGIISNATEITNATLVKIGDCEHHLKYYREDTASYRYIVCTVVGHYIGNTFYPAYCLNKDLTGVTDEYSYTVNIKEVINRDDIWRVVKNGYPYKTCQEMGLTNDFDAYMITKMAVYCLLGQSDINKFYAEPNDPIANSMLNCLKNLVNIGVSGTETRTSGNFSISKVGNLIKEEKYYTQKYKVNSNIEMNDFYISGISGFPTGVYTEKLDSSNFKLYIPKDKLTNNINGDINIKGKCRTYPIFYGESGNPNYQDYAITYDSFGDVSSVCRTSFTTNTGSLKIEKIDSESNEKIPNTKIGLYRDGKLLQSKITDKSGILVFTNLFPSNYEIKELQANEDYVLDNVSKNKIEVFYNMQSKITLSNEHKKGNLKITKVDKDDNSKLLEGIEFELYKESGEFIGKYVTDKNGEIKINKLNTGKYKLKEVKTKDGYKLLDEISLEIKWNETTELELSNEKNKGKIKIIKVDKDNNEIKIPGVEFGIFNQKNELIEKIVTNENGEAISSNLPIHSMDYYIKELKTNEKYVLSEKIVKIELKENEITNIKFENELKKGNLELLKLDKDTKVPLEGVEFELYDSENNLINTYKTDKNGKIFVENLKVQNNYYLKEIKTNQGYKLLEENTYFNINYKETTKLEITNEKNKGKIKIIKVDKDNNEKRIPGVKFGIYNEKQELLEELITDENGEVISSYYPIYNTKYYIQELETNEKYELNKDIITIELKENEITTIKFENELKRGKLELLKLDKDTKEPIEGVEFEVYDYENNSLGRYVTDESGKIFVENLKPKTNYYLKEIKTKEEYKLSEDKIYFDIKSNEITNLEITNEKIKGKLKVIKVDKDDKTKKLEGVKFDIYDEKSNLLESIVTDKDGVAFSSLLPCVNRIYTIVENSTIEGYIKNEEYMFFELNESEIFELIVENEKIKPKESEKIIQNEEKVVEEIRILPRTGY